MLMLECELFPVSDVTVSSAPQSAVSPSHFSGPAAGLSLSLSEGPPQTGGSYFEREFVRRGS